MPSVLPELAGETRSVKEMIPAPPRDGEGDRSPQASGGGVLAASPAAVELARREHRSGNLPEILVWRALRMRPGGFKFRRQHPIGNYSLNSACLAARLAIEIDGEIHTRGSQPERDRQRDAVLRQLGFRVMRIAARDVLNDLESVITGIVFACRQVVPLHHPADGLPPRSGEVRS